MQKFLIVTADDFGLHPVVNEGIEQASRSGVLTAASLMMGARAVEDAVSRARRLPALRVGLHVVLADGWATLPPAEIPGLVDRDGHMDGHMFERGVRFFAVPRIRRQLEAEIRSQFAAFARTGLRLDHVNAHKHFHLHPTIAGLILKVGRRFGLRASRLPIEPRAVLGAVEPGDYPAQPVVDLWAGLARRRFRAAGLLVPDHVFGLRWSGAMTAARLGGLIANLPPGLSEIYTHPATGDYLGGAPGYRYREELEALIDPAVIEAARGFTGVRGRFADCPGHDTGDRVSLNIEAVP